LCVQTHFCVLSVYVGRERVVGTERKREREREREREKERERERERENCF
jgi:hypothetical protein